MRQLVAGAQVDGAEDVAVLGNRLEQDDVVALALVAGLARVRRQRHLLAVRHVRREQRAVLVVQRGRAHQRPDTQQCQVLARQARIVERQRDGRHVADQFGLGREVVQQRALVAAQVIRDHAADRDDEGRERGRHHDRDELLADRAGTDRARREQGHHEPACPTVSCAKR
jgi:hypothetical protein